MTANPYQLVDGVLLQKVVDETVILEPETGHYFTLDSVGSVMVEAVVEGKSVDEMAQQVVAEFDVSTDQVKADFTELAEKMCAQGLLKKV